MSSIGCLLGHYWSIYLSYVITSKHQANLSAQLMKLWLLIAHEWVANQWGTNILWAELWFQEENGIWLSTALSQSHNDTDVF